LTWWFTFAKVAAVSRRSAEASRSSMTLEEIK
jgi:hypothetical protein